MRDIDLFMKELTLSGYKVDKAKHIFSGNVERRLFHKEFIIREPFEGNKADIHLSITNKQYSVYLMPLMSTFIPDRFFWSFDEAADYIMELLRNE